MTKSMAEEISEKLCESMAASLEAKKLASFTRISSTVQGLDDDAALKVGKLYEELVELWPDGATMELNALYVEQKIGRGHCTAGLRICFILVLGSDFSEGYHGSLFTKRF